MEILRRNFRDFDFTILGVMIALAVFSCVALLAATYGKTGGDVPTHIVLKQSIFEVIGLIAMGFVAAYDYRTLRKLRWWIYGISIFLLLAVFAMPRVQGAHSWIPLGLLSLQPSEFAKITMIIAIAAHMADVDEQELPDYGIRQSWQPLLLFLVPFALTLKEPALGQALVMFAIAVTMYMMFAKRSVFALMVSAVFIVVGFLAVIAVQYPVQSTAFIENVLIKHHVLHQYQADRIVTWLDPSYDPLGAGFNVRQAQIAVGSGQVFGEGLFSGIETRGGWVPNQWTDYIFSAIGEEFGFVGGSALIFLFLVFIYRMVRISGSSQDTFGTYLVMGAVGMFAFQIFENIGMDMYLSPSTGITLPFISYGGSSLVANYITVGLALSVWMRRKRLRFS